MSCDCEWGPKETSAFSMPGETVLYLEFCRTSFVLPNDECWSVDGVRGCISLLFLFWRGWSIRVWAPTWRWRYKSYEYLSAIPQHTMAPSVSEVETISTGKLKRTETQAVPRVIPEVRDPIPSHIHVINPSYRESLIRSITLTTMLPKNGLL